MRVRKCTKQISLSFEVVGEITNDVQQQQQTQIIHNFIQTMPYFSYPSLFNLEMQKFKKKLIAFSVQYGIRNEKTTCIFLKYLQSCRQIAINHLTNNDLTKAISFFVDCLKLQDPDDQIFLEKFIIIKIDIINKLMYCFSNIKLDQQQGHQDNKKIQLAIQFLQHFLHHVRECSFYRNLLSSKNCMLELNHFYLAQLYYKIASFYLAIEQWNKAKQITNIKLMQLQQINKSKYSQKTNNPQNYVVNILIKIYYKISKCYRMIQNKPQQQKHEQQALSMAQKNNKSLYIYIRRKIRLYNKKKQFQKKLSLITNRKKIEQQITRLIQQSKQNQFVSMYDVYLDQLPNQQIQPKNTSRKLLNNHQI